MVVRSAARLPTDSEILLGLAQREVDRQKRARKLVLPALLVIVVLFAVPVILFLRGRASVEVPLAGDAQSSVPAYAWQSSCDARCAGIVGGTLMRELDASDCATLDFSRTLLQNAQEYNDLGDGSSAWHTPERLAALHDRFASLGCTSR
jgi:hypothetical protein